MIGQVLTRHKGEGPRKVRVVGSRGQAWIVEPVDEFTAPFAISSEQLRADYGGDGAAPAEVDEVALQTAVAARRLHRDLQRGYAAHDRRPAGQHEPDPDSAEGQFRAADEG